MPNEPIKTKNELVSSQKAIIVDTRMADPFLRPSWRFDRVLKMIGRSPVPMRTTIRDDAYIRDTRAFMLRWRKGERERMRLQDEMPGLYFAYQIWDRVERDPEVQFMVEARLLANQDIAEIADAIKTIPETIEWYEAVFFNVLPHLRHHDWIMKHVLLPATDRYSDANTDDDGDDEEEGNTVSFYVTPAIVNPDLDSTLKYFSYFGGPLLCEFMISGFKRGKIVHSQDDIGDWLDEQFMMNTRQRSAQVARVFRVTKYDALDLFATHLRIMEVLKSTETQEERHTTIEKHIHAMLTEIPWTVGKDARKMVEGTVFEEYDDLAAELNDEEQMLLGSGQVLDLDEVKQLTFDSRRAPEGRDATAKNPKSN